ncbi:hypothetical protein [Halomarina ordinaria]|uniref:DUF2892 domain-containing protein n=1 Tax=Halomarina ordinaria TaxID=3033939 RepID=A0ABD5UC19_9EURY|nr:hypothetical protein [Halomarina sp. PSRA2]
MSSPFENPIVRYGIGLCSASILVIVAFTLVDGTTRWVILGLAVVELLVLPPFLKYAQEQNEQSA